MCVYVQRCPAILCPTFCLNLSPFLVSLVSVHNWTQDEALRWLKEFVELPQYERNFKDFKVNGNTLPR